MTSDHFRQFLINPGRQASGLGGTPTISTNLGATDSPSIKFHLAWALVAGGAALASWKVSKWHSSYEKLEAKRTLVANKKKQHKS